MKKFLIIICALSLWKVHAQEMDAVDIDKVSETLGHLIIKQLDNPSFTFNVDKIISGMRNGQEGKASPLTEEEYEAQVQLIQKKIYEKTSEDNLKIALDFLEKNKKEEGVISLNDELQYKITQKGEGETVLADATPLVHYTGKTIDGNVFASSKEMDKPISLPLKTTLAGFSQGIVGMKKGEKRTLYLHPELASGLGSPLPPNSLLIFEVEMVEIDSKEVAEIVAPEMPS